MELTATNAEVASIMLALAAGEMSETDVANWIDTHAGAL
jgi:hypothetical protein